MDIRTGPGIVVKQEYTMQQAPRTCYFCGTVGHTSKHCDEFCAYEQAGKVKVTNGRITMGDGAWIPREQGKTMKEVLDAILQERKRTRDVPPHVTTGLLYLTGPEIEVEMDIEPSAYLQTSTGNDPDVSDPDYEDYYEKRAVYMAAEAKLKTKGKSVHFDGVDVWTPRTKPGPSS